MAAALKVYKPAIFPDDVDAQLMNSVNELGLQLTSLHRADVAILPSLQLLDQCETLTDTFLLELARYSLGENRAGPGRAVTVDWLFNSVYAKRILPFDAYEVKLEVIEGHMGARAEGKWIVGDLCSAVPDEAARSAAARASRPSSTGDKDAFDDHHEPLAPAFPTPSNSAADLVSPHHGSAAPGDLATASSPLSSAPSSPLSEINVIDLPSSIKPTGPLKPAVPSKSRSCAAPHRPSSHTYPGETKGYRDRSQIRQVDKAPLDTLICLLRARLTEDQRPVKSWKMLFRDLDRETLPTLTPSTPSSADYIILNNSTHLDVPLPADLLRNIAWSCSGYRRPQAGIALNSDWLIDSLKRGRALPVWGYQIEVVWHRISEPGEAWMEWRDAGGRPIESEAGRKLVLGTGGPAVEDTSGRGANLWGFDEDVVSCEDPFKIGGFIPDPTPDAETLQSSDEKDDSQAFKIVRTAFDPPAPAATKRRKTSSKANPFTVKRRRPRKTARLPATLKAPKGPIKRSISALTELVNRKSPAPAGPPNVGGASVKKRQRQREAVREEDEAALDKIVGMLAAAIANDDHLKPTRSLGWLCEELDRKDPHPKGIQWRSFYRSYELFVLDRVPGLAGWLQNRSRSTSVLVSGV